jgi:hypothetical protein
VSATLIYRALIAIRGCWFVLEGFFGWGPYSDVTELTLFLPALFAIAGNVVVALLLVILAGMWFFQRWARLTFVVILAVALVTTPFRANYSFSSPPSFVLAIEVFVLILTGAIVAMSFLPPVRDHFAKNEV